MIKKFHIQYSDYTMKQRDATNHPLNASLNPTLMYPGGGNSACWLLGHKNHPK